jgi:predicted Zn-dependent peptidase
LKFERTVLDSGATVVTEPMSEVRSASVGFWFDVGSRDEPESLAGTSHFLEHLLFKGTPTRTAKDIADAFDAVGGDVNAFTGKEYTCYYCRVLDDDLPMALDVLSDMLTNSALDPSEFDSERKVILEEIAMHEDTPEELVHDLFYQSMWDGHPLGRPVLGFNSTIGAVERARVVTYWRERYSAANLVVAAAGRIDHDDLVTRVGALFSGSNSRTRTVRTGGAPTSASGVSVHRRPTEQAHIVVGGEGLDRADPDRYALSLLDTVLGGGMSSRLFQEIREKRGLAYSVYSYRSMFRETGTFAVYAGTAPPNAEVVIDLVRREVESVAGDGITEEELVRAKGHLKGSLVLSSEDPASRMNRLGRQELTTGEILSIDELVRRYDDVEMDDIERVAGRVLRSRSFQTTVIGPFEHGAFDRFAA